MKAIIANIIINKYIDLDIGLNILGLQQWPSLWLRQNLLKLLLLEKFSLIFVCILHFIFDLRKKTYVKKDIFFLDSTDIRAVPVCPCPAMSFLFTHMRDVTKMIVMMCFFWWC